MRRKIVGRLKPFPMSDEERRLNAQRRRAVKDVNASLLPLLGMVVISLIILKVLLLVYEVEGL
jgi:hypothetical protein